MASLLETMFSATAVPAFKTMYGVSATYKVGGTGTGATITLVSLSAIDDSQADDQDASFRVYRAQATIAIADVAVPACDDTVTIDSVVWAIEEPIMRNGSFTDLPLRRNVFVSQGKTIEATTRRG